MKPLSRSGPGARVAAALAAAAVAAVALAGCGSSGSSSTSTSTSASAGSAAPSASAAAAAFPVTVTAANGAVTIKSRPARIVSLDPTSTEDLYAIGAGPQVVAVDQDSNYPAGVPKTGLSGLTPNIEAIAKYNPSLVVASQNSGGLVSGMAKLGIPVLIEPAVATLDAAYAQIQQVGTGDRARRAGRHGRDGHEAADRGRRGEGGHRAQGRRPTTGS